MSNLVSRILLAILLVPLSVILYFAVGAAIFKGPGSPQGLDVLFMHILVGFFIVLYWLTLWRKLVRWTQWRKVTTFLSGLGCVVAGALFGTVVGVMVRFPERDRIAFTIFLGGFLTIVLWLIVSVLLWRETAAERAERIHQVAGEALCCPKCGYNLTGLRGDRCPECGTRLTLDQLYAAQRRPGLEETTVPADQAAK